MSASYWDVKGTFFSIKRGAHTFRLAAQSCLCASVVVATVSLPGALLCLTRVSSQRGSSLSPTVVLRSKDA